MKAFQLQPLLLKKNSIHIFLNRKVIGYIFLFIVLILSSSIVSIISHISESIFMIVTLIQLVNFISIGILNAALIENRPFFAYYTRKERFYFTLLLTAVVYGALQLLSFITGNNMQGVALLGSCAFLLPVMIFQAWHYFIQIPVNKSKIWSDYKPVAENDILYLRTILVNIKLSGENMPRKKAFSIYAPLNLELGKFFNTFMNTEKLLNTIDIEYVDQDDIPYGWKFYAVSFDGLYKRILDPEKSLNNNKIINKNTTIVAKRVRTR